MDKDLQYIFNDSIKNKRLDQIDDIFKKFDLKTKIKIKNDEEVKDFDHIITNLTKQLYRYSELKLVEYKRTHPKYTDRKLFELFKSELESHVSGKIEEFKHKRKRIQDRKDKILKNLQSPPKKKRGRPKKVEQ